MAEIETPDTPTPELVSDEPAAEAAGDDAIPAPGPAAAENDPASAAPAVIPEPEPEQPVLTPAEAVAEASGETEAVAEASDETEAVAEASGDTEAVAEESDDTQAVTEASGETEAVAEDADDTQAVTEASAETEAVAEDPNDTQAVAVAPAEPQPEIAPEPGSAPEPAGAVEAMAVAAAPEGADEGGADDDGDGDDTVPVEDTPEVAALRQAREDGTAIDGKVIGWNKGGFHVAIAHELTAFCPNSEMELGRPRDPATYVDRDFTFRVLKVQKRGRRIVLSRKAVLAGDRERLLAEMLPRLVPGAVFEGRVTSITDFGAFVDLGGLEGLVHVSEISRRRVAHPSEALQLGGEVTVKVLKVENDGDRISLSMKALEPDPWHGVVERFPRGSEFDGTVVRKTDFGVFVELAPEIDGLIHLSRMPPGMTMEDPVVAIGTPVHGWVQEVDAKRKRISLSLRAIPADDPWKTVAERFPEGTGIEGTVESTSPFGAFINLEPGLTGLLPTSEMQVPRGTNPARHYSPGQKVHVLVAAVDPRRRRISLVREGAKIEGSRNDYQSFLKKQQKESHEGLSAMASAFAKLKDPG